MITKKDKFVPRECLRVIQNLFASPKYTELRIGMKAYIKLMCYCHLAGEQEITGFGRIKNGEIIDFKIPRQAVTGTTADATEDEIMELLREIPIDEIPEWELDWHSHVNMGVFISSTDEASYEEISMSKGGKQFPILVVNKKGEVCCKNFIHEGRVPEIKFTLLKSDISNAEINKIYAECKEEVAEKLRMKPIVVKKEVGDTWYKPSYTQSRLSYGNYGNYGNNYYGNSSRKNEQSDFVDDTDDFADYGKCQACGIELLTAEEYENGLCDDCLNAWAISQK